MISRTEGFPVKPVNGTLQGRILDEDIQACICLLRSNADYSMMHDGRSRAVGDCRPVPAIFDFD